ncbi:hypothetical protein H5T56_04705 [Candidatus Bipolaricaulota bacterium]|nr:hypothetical protein [Candidatus Bipolaricaulota bacterium]
MRELYLSFLWHMHQPWYVLPESTRAELPWVRLRASKDYYDMALYLKEAEFPAAVNFTPSLARQLELYSQGKICDPYTPEGDREALKEIRTGLIPRPLARRGFPQTEEDLWVSFYLAWLSQTFLEENGFLSGLDRTDKALAELARIQRELVSQVLPLYRGLQEEGQIELTTTPFYHPILPLLIDTQVARRSRPEDEVPEFSAHDDAELQVQRALNYHEEVFGERPRGMWPAEAAVSPEALALMAQAGVQWVATDEGILARTLGRPPAPEELYRPWSFSFGNLELCLFFRDSTLSNLLSFDYGKWPTEEAVRDFLARLEAVRARYRGTSPPLVLVAMDGENAWDHYERNGRPFLLGLYRAIKERDFIPITPGEYLARFGPEGKLTELWSGSWIDADFRTWIGEEKQNRAWRALARLKEAFHAAPKEAQQKALESILILEGSDWYWWRSSRNPTPLAHRFARIFREHLRYAYVALGKEPSEDLEMI